MSVALESAGDHGPPPDGVSPETVIETSNQIVDAMLDLDRPADQYTRWPFPDLAELTGPMAPGDVWFICARSGGGKTTFVTSCIMRWLVEGRRLYVMPLETRPKSFRTYLACMQAGIPPGEALSGQLRQTPEGQQARKVLEGLLLEQIHEPLVSRLQVNGASAINEEALEQAFGEAMDFGADIILIDHIDHVQGEGRTTDLYGTSVNANKKLLKLAQRADKLVIATSQLNLQGAQGDALMRYQPPRDQDVYMGNFKRTVATGMIGLFRPVRAQKPGESEEEFTNAIRAARKGLVGPQDVLERDMMGVVAMKLRNYGQRENERCFLGVTNGRCVPLAERVLQARFP